MTTDLIANIGGTNLRFAEVQEGEVIRQCDYGWPSPPSIAGVAKEFLAGKTPRAVAIALASPVTEDDRLVMPNNLYQGQPYSFSRAQLQAELGAKQLVILNDFTAVAAALPHLKANELRKVGTGQAAPGWPLAVLGAGTGLGVSGAIPTPAGFHPLTAEGGHATMAPSTAQEEQVLSVLRQKFGHVSQERVLSGMGLQNLYGAICQVEGRSAETLSPADISTRALANSDPACRSAVEMFCALMGTAASNLALTLGARGGVYIAGGIVPKILPLFETSDFRTRFCDKGRYRAYMEAIPTYVVLHPNPELVGVKSCLPAP